MKAVTQPQLLAVLDDVRSRVAVADSFEGSLVYTLPDDDDDPKEVYARIKAVYRVGNSEGQGGMVMIGVDLEPDERYRVYSNHALKDVPLEVLHAARSVIAGAVAWNDVDPDQAVPIAEAVVAGISEAGFEFAPKGGRQVAGVLS